MKTARTLGFVILFSVLALAGCGGRNNKLPAVGDSAAPDKALFDRAQDDLKHNKFEVARLTLQALINTYPDSEYLALAKLAIADSYFKEGGTANLTQASSEYTDFITFFPFLPQAAYAQMQVGMTHYRRLTKPDRDRSEAQLAEQAFQVFMQKYPDSELAPTAAQHLREVQEVLAEGDFRIATFYNTKKSYNAAGRRLIDIAARYPLYSRSDDVLWMLAEIYQKNKQNPTAGAFYARIVRDYPLSPRVSNAKERLTQLGVPIPQPDPAALARMQQNQQLTHNRSPFVGRVSEMVHSGPDVSQASKVGAPNLDPPDDASGMETFNAALKGMTLTGGASGAGGASGGASGGTPAPGAGAPAGSTATVVPPASGSGSATNPGSATPPAPGTGAPATTPANPPSSASPPPSTSGGTPQPGPQTTTPKPCPANDKQGKQATPPKDGKTPDCKPETGKESSSKKKGLRRLIPW